MSDTNIPRPLALGRVVTPAGTRSRQTYDNLTLFAGRTLTSQPDDQFEWRVHDLDGDALNRLRSDELMLLLANVSPELSRALWDFLVLANPGYTITVTRPGTDDPDARGQAVLDGFLGRLNQLHGAVDVIIDRLFIAAYMRGALFAELVLDPTARAPVDLVAPDPQTVRFRRVIDPIRGQRYELGQHQDGVFRPLEHPTIRYIPIHPLPGAPYGRAPAGPGVFSALFLIGMLHDLRRVIAQQGYPRIDIEVNLESIRQAMPEDDQTDPEKVFSWVNAAIGQVEEAYAKLQPDDAYIHTDASKVHRPVGTLNAQALGSAEGIIRAIERMATRALKTMPILMGSNEGVSETHANRQWEIMVAAIKSIQNYASRLLGDLLGMALQVQGVAAVVRVQFHELRAAEMMRDAQTRQLAGQNAKFEYDQGWISHEEASVHVTGHAPDAPAPRLVTPPPTASPAINPDPGADRQRRSVPLTETPPITDADLDRAARVWDSAMPEYRDLLRAEVEVEDGADD